VTWGRNAYQDVLFIGVITIVVLTGILSEVFRLATFHDGAAAAYYLHLVFIFFLIFYAPFSKFAHVVYHTTALAWAHHVGRELKTLPVEQAKAAEKAA
jgi:quinone-modifying oxidoreductase subunit QmoC